MMLYEDLSKKIVHAAHVVHNELGFGFLEAVYGNALYKELTKLGLLINFGHSVKVKRKILTKGGETDEIEAVS